MSLTQRSLVIQQRKQARIEAILDAAEKAFLAQGYDGANIDRIAQAAGLAKATVYSHFGSKECLYEAMLKRCRDRLPPLPRLGDGDLDAWRHELERAFENAPYCKDPVLATSIFIHLLIDAPTLTALLHSTAAPSDRKLIATLVAPPRRPAVARRSLPLH